MKRKILLIVCFFVSFTFAKTWESNLQECDELGGFWFPDHKWTDKDGQWIKPFMFGESLRDYGETGISFNYDMPGWIPNAEEPFDIVNVFNIRHSMPSANVSTPIDSVYFFCNGSTDGSIAKKSLDAKNISIDEFDFLVPNSTSGFNLNSDYFDLQNYNANCLETYFIYKKYENEFEYTALCEFSDLDGRYKIQCEFQDDGTMNFDKIPDLNTIPKDFCSAYENMKIQPGNSKIKEALSNGSSYKVNGTHSKNGSSNVIIKNYQPTLQLKGELK